MPNALGKQLTPSAVSVAKGGQAWVGEAALDRMATHPRDTATSFKRMIGTASTVTLAGTTLTPEDLSAMVLRSLADDVEAATGERPTEAVITVPAYFNERQRRATRRAGEIAGLEVRRLINEPTAAALAFGLADRGDREPFLVFDLGGGTFDVSIVEMFDGIVEVRASAGDNRLGGDDFDEVLVKLVEPLLENGEALTACPPTSAARFSTSPPNAPAARSPAPRQPSSASWSAICRSPRPSPQMPSRRLPRAWSSGCAIP